MSRSVCRWPGVSSIAALALSLLIALAGCGGSHGEPTAEAPPSSSAVIDAAGGSVVGPDGVRLDVPAGALSAPVTITIARDSAGAPALMQGQSGAVYAITPHGLQFQKPAVLTFPPALLPAGSAAQSNVLRAQPGGSWEVLDPPVATFDLSASVLLDGLSYYGMAGIGSSGSGRRTGVIETSVGWAEPAPGVDLPSTGLGPVARRIVERTVVHLVVSAGVDPWCGGSATLTSSWLRWSASAPTRYVLMQKQTRSVSVAAGSARAVFDYDVPVATTMEYYMFAGSAVCDNPAPLPPNPPQYAPMPHALAVYLEAVAVAAPAITQQPVDVSAVPGDTVNFAVAATAPDTLAITWQRSDDGGTSWLDVSASAAQFTFALLPGQTASLWRARVCNVSANGFNCLNSVSVRVSAPSAEAPWQVDSLMAGSGTHSMAVGGTSGSVLSWGTNNGGALGRNSGDPAPAPVVGPAMRSVAAGAWYSIGLTLGGEVYAWGWGDNVGAAIGSSDLDNPVPRRVAALTDVAGIATRYSHTLAVKTNGEVWGFGPEQSLALGPLQGHRGVRRVPGLVQMRQVAAGERHSLALAADGAVWTWGENGSGQLGLGAAAVGMAHDTPQAVAGLTDVIEIVAGSATSFALRRDGSVWSWGDAALIGRGGDATVPAPVPGLVSVRHIGSGHRSAWALMGDNTAYGWGDNRFGQVGVGSSSALIATPVRLPTGLQYAALAGGEFHSMAMVVNSQGRTVFGFGSNGNRQLDGLPGPNLNVPGGGGVNLP